MITTIINLTIIMVLALIITVLWLAIAINNTQISNTTEPLAWIMGGIACLLWLLAWWISPFTIIVLHGSS